MIHLLKGHVLSQKNDIITILMEGIGLQVSVPEHSSIIIGTHVTLYTYMHWNQETGPSLFGFNEAPQRDLFCLLITVSGIGPRMALTLISSLSVSSVIDALITGNISLLSSVSGIGRKKAETLILHLKDKAEKFPISTEGSSGNASSLTMHLKDLSDALVSLGYSRQEIVQAIEQVRTTEGISDIPFDQLLRKALNFLSKKR